MHHKVYLIDVTNRDGVQTSKILVPKLSKTDTRGIHFSTDNNARTILELVQYANLHTQEPLTDDELRLMASYPDVVKKVLTVNP